MTQQSHLNISFTSVLPCTFMYPSRRASLNRAHIVKLTARSTASRMHASFLYLLFRIEISPPIYSFSRVLRRATATTRRATSQPIIEDAAEGSRLPSRRASYRWLLLILVALSRASQMVERFRHACYCSQHHAQPQPWRSLSRRRQHILPLSTYAAIDRFLHEIAP